MNKVLLLMSLLSTSAVIVMAITNAYALKKIEKTETELRICEDYIAHVAKKHNKAFIKHKQYMCYENIQRFRFRKLEKFNKLFRAVIESEEE